MSARACSTEANHSSNAWVGILIGRTLIRRRFPVSRREAASLLAGSVRSFEVSDNYLLAQVGEGVALANGGFGGNAGDVGTAGVVQEF